MADFDLDGRPGFATSQFDSDSIAIVLAAPGGDYEPPMLDKVIKAEDT